MWIIFSAHRRAGAFASYLPRSLANLRLGDEDNIDRSSPPAGRSAGLVSDIKLDITHFYFFYLFFSSFHRLQHFIEYIFLNVNLQIEMTRFVLY